MSFQSKLSGKVTVKDYIFLSQLIPKYGSAVEDRMIFKGIFSKQQE